MHTDGRRWRAVLASMACVAVACGSPSDPSTPPSSAQPTLTSTTVAVTTSVARAPVTTVVSSLPLGDGKRSTSPEKGSLFSCQTTFGAGPGAFRDGPWIRSDGTWDPSTKLHVQGAVAWPQAVQGMQVDGSVRTITTNGVPGQNPTGVFPVAATDPAYQYDRNPNTIVPRAMTFTLPAAPTVAGTPSCVGMGAIGVLSDGVVLYNALDAQGRDAAAHEVLDGCDGHPERTGQYHHHTVPTCGPFAATGTSTLVGHVFDGFGLYVEWRADGSMLTNADLDECHGRTSPVVWDGRTVTMYHYVATLEYPYTVGCYRGTPVRR
jgi:hypothetical protein